MNISGRLKNNLKFYFVFQTVAEPDMDRTKKTSRWYFGGLASAGAACCTHPLDLLKVALQTQQEGKISMIKLTSKVIQQQGDISNLNYYSSFTHF